MVEHQIAPQKEYKTLEDFIREQNNFYLYFLDDCFIGNEVYRAQLPFKRFQEQNPEMERDVTKATVQSKRSKQRQELPYEKLWEAYKIMSKLVYVDDEHVMHDGQPDSWYLCR